MVYRHRVAVYDEPAMASYGAVHKDDKIWNLVAFVQRLPKMTPEQYGQMERASADTR